MSLCVLCATEGASPTALPPGDDTALLCPVCAAALAGDLAPDPRWRCLSDAIWSEDPAAQIAAWRLLAALANEPWAADLLATVWLDPEVLARAHAGIATSPATGTEHRDSNGAVLAAGDTVVLIKDLPVKGSSMVAKRGTAVRGIRLVPDNPGQIEGRVNGQKIVLLTQFVKKSG